MKTASWVIISAETGKAMLETWDADKAAWINANAASKARAVPIGEYLASLNAPAQLAPYAEEMTPIGPQLVIPGCERKAIDKRSPNQLNLFA